MNRLIISLLLFAIWNCNSTNTTETLSNTSSATESSGENSSTQTGSSSASSDNSSTLSSSNSHADPENVSSDLITEVDPLIITDDIFRTSPLDLRTATIDDLLDCEEIEDKNENVYHCLKDCSKQSCFIKKTYSCAFNCSEDSTMHRADDAVYEKLKELQLKAMLFKGFDVASPSGYVEEYFFAHPVDETISPRYLYHREGYYKDNIDTSFISPHKGNSPFTMFRYMAEILVLQGDLYDMEYHAELGYITKVSPVGSTDPSEDFGFYEWGDIPYVERPWDYYCITSDDCREAGMGSICSIAYTGPWCGHMNFLDESPPNECETFSDCDDGYKCERFDSEECVEGEEHMKCFPTCAVMECEEGYTCDNDACVIDCDSYECDSGLTCIDHECVVPCENIEDCPVNNYCTTNGKCKKAGQCTYPPP